MEEVNDREEFIRLYNSYRIYNFTTFSDEIVREFLPYIDIGEHFCYGYLSDTIIEEFYDILSEQLGEEIIQNVPPVMNTLKKYTQIIPQFTLNANQEVQDVSYRITVSDVEFFIKIAKKTSVRMSHSRTMFLSHPLTEQKLIGSINTLLFDYN